MIDICHPSDAHKRLWSLTAALDPENLSRSEGGKPVSTLRYPALKHFSVRWKHPTSGKKPALQNDQASVTRKTAYNFVHYALALACGITIGATPIESATAQVLPNYPAASPIINSPTVTPAIYFEFSTLTGSGNTIYAIRVPVRTSTGAFKYFDIAMQYNVNSAGTPVLASGFPKVTPSVSLNVSGFKAGKYESIISSSKKAIAIVDGPGIGPNGTTAWSFNKTSDSDRCTNPESAAWYTGPISSNPLAARLKAAGITHTGYSYGISGGGCTSAFSNGRLLGVAQTGNALTIVSFTNVSGKDQSVPIDQITYRLSP